MTITADIPSIRQGPFRRVGVTMTGEATTNPDVAIIQAGLNWTADKVPLRTADTLDVVEDYCAIRRSDDKRILSVVGKDYEPFQNSEMFNVFRDIARVSPYKIESAGSFQNGKVVYALCNLPQLGIVLGDDYINCALLVSNSHDGRKQVTITPTTIRIICQNSLRMAEAQSRNERRKGKLTGGFVVKHTKNMNESIEEVKEIFNEAIRSKFATEEIFRHLARVPLSTKLKYDFMVSVFGKGGDESERAKTICKNREERISAILSSPTSQVRGTKDSAFSMLNAVTEYVDHFRTTRTTDGNENEARLMSALMGSGNVLKERAWDRMLELVG